MFVQYTWPRSWSTTMPSARSSIPVIKVRTRVPSKDTACISCLPSLSTSSSLMSALAFSYVDVSRGEGGHGLKDRRNVPAGLHDGAVGPDNGGGRPALLQPATELAVPTDGDDHGSAALELLFLRSAERGRGDQREPVSDNLVEAQAITQNRVGAKGSGELPGSAGFDPQRRLVQPGGHAVGCAGARARQANMRQPREHHLADHVAEPAAAGHRR